MILPVGTVVADRYVVEATLGEGAMAHVYRARHRGTRQKCALKFVQAHLAGRPELLELFLREARVGAVIGKNPFIVEVFDAGFDPSLKCPYIAMELLEGETLDRYSARLGPLPAAVVALLLGQLADALDQAHKAGVVHRDIKPQNLFVTRDHKGGLTLKVADFGIAKILEQAPQSTATAIGTPAYSAPEQLGPLVRKLASEKGIPISTGVSAATDVWPLGLIAYELLTGSPAGEYAGSVVGVELALTIALESPVPPSTKAGERASLLPAGFDAWFLSCLEKDASARWPSAGRAVENLSLLLGAQGSAKLTESEMASTPEKSSDKAPPTGTVRMGTSEVEDVVALSRGNAIAPLPGSAPLGAKMDLGKTARRRRIVALASVLASAITLIVAVRMGVFRSSLAVCEDEALDREQRVPACEHACADNHPKSCRRVAALAGDKSDMILDALERSCRVVVAGEWPGDNRDCGLAAERLLSGGRIAPDPRRAASLYEVACARADREACVKLASMLAAGIPEKDEPRAVQLFDGACKRKDVESCLKLAQAYENGGMGVSKASREALGYFERACPIDAGRDWACIHAADWYEQGWGETTIDPARAAQLFELACEHVRGAGCAGAAAHRLKAFKPFPATEDPLGKRNDNAKKDIAVLFDVACKAGAARGCVGAMELFRQWRELQSRTSNAALESTLVEACKSGDGRACWALGAYHSSEFVGHERDSRQAYTFYLRACDVGSARGCQEQATCLRDGFGVPQDAGRAVELYRLACELADCTSCMLLGRAYFDGDERGLKIKKEPQRGVYWYGRGCDQGCAESCELLGEAYETGDPALRDPEKPLAAFEKACRADQRDSCAHLAFIRARSAKTDDARKKAKDELFDLCATKKHQWSCDRYRMLE